mgnify:CR=1 FL=1
MLSYTIIGQQLLRYTTMAFIFTALIVVILLLIWFGSTRDI